MRGGLPGVAAPRASTHVVEEALHLPLEVLRVSLDDVGDLLEDRLQPRLPGLRAAWGLGWQAAEREPRRLLVAGAPGGGAGGGACAP